MTDYWANVQGAYCAHVGRPHTCIDVAMEAPATPEKAAQDILQSTTLHSYDHWPRIYWLMKFLYHIWPSTFENVETFFPREK